MKKLQKNLMILYQTVGHYFKKMKTVILCEGLAPDYLKRQKKAKTDGKNWKKSNFNTYFRNL